MSIEHNFFVTCFLTCLVLFVLCQENKIGNGVCVKYNRITGIRRYSCCSNYTAATPYDDYMKPKCKPICSPACTNGICFEPGKCRCYLGYTLDPSNDRNCLPECYSGCANGVCILPDLCQCNYGYRMTNSGCLPVCTEPCKNGTCISPENCLCNTGYRTSETNNYICEPYCSYGCNNGRCVGPETCACDAGWKQVDNNTCEPICSPSCFNGICVAPNKCKCNSGYEFPTATLGYWNYACVPHPTTTTTYIPSTVLLETSTTGTEDFSDQTETVVVNVSVEFSTQDTIEHEIKTIVVNTTIGNMTERTIDIKGHRNIWIYATVSVVAIVLAILLLLVIKTKCFNYIKGGSYVVEDSHRQPNSPQNSYNVTFSSISQKQ